MNKAEQNGNSPAMPTVDYDRSAAMNNVGVSVTKDAGMTKRETFAMNASPPEGVIREALNKNTEGWGFVDYINMVVMYKLNEADALLAALEANNE